MNVIKRNTSVYAHIRALFLSYKSMYMNMVTKEAVLTARKEQRKLYHTRPSVDGLMPETIMLLSPTCCFDFRMESLPSNFCDQNKVSN